MCVETNKSKNMNITEMRKPEKRMQKIILNILLHMQSSELVKVQVRKGFRWETRLVFMLCIIVTFDDTFKSSHLADFTHD